MASILSIQMCNMSLVCSVIDLAIFFLAHQNASICLSRSLLDGIMLEGWVSDCAYAPYWMCTARFMCHICRGTLQNFQLWTGGCPSPVVQLRNALVLGVQYRDHVRGCPRCAADGDRSSGSFLDIGAYYERQHVGGGLPTAQHAARASRGP